MNNNHLLNKNLPDIFENLKPPYNKNPNLSLILQLKFAYTTMPRPWAQALPPKLPIFSKEDNSTPNIHICIVISIYAGVSLMCTLWMPARRTVSDDNPNFEVDEMYQTTEVAATVFQYGEKEWENNNNGDCSICLEEFVEGEVCRILLRCKHVFHRDCVDKWLPRHPHCPLCRSPIWVLHSYAATS